MDELIELMGEDYAYSFEGRLYLAWESIMSNTSTGKFKRLGIKIITLYPTEVREKYLFQHRHKMVDLESLDQIESLIKDLPRISKPVITEVSSHIMYSCPSKGKDLLSLWRGDPESTSWESLNSFKLLTGIHGIKGGWS